MSEPIYAYKTITTDSEGRFQSRGSKFIAYTFPMDSLEVLEERIVQLKSEHPKARHHCYGYRILFENGIREYCSDDGEPSGSSGKPILAALKSGDLLNVGCVVVRYFGGTKLGIPGLIEAYGSSSKNALGGAKVSLVHRSAKYRIEMPMQLQPHMLNTCKKLNIPVTNLTYTETFQLNINVPLKNEIQTLLQLLKALSGRDYIDIEKYESHLNMHISKFTP